MPLARLAGPAILGAFPPRAYLPRYVRLRRPRATARPDDSDMTMPSPGRPARRFAACLGALLLVLLAAASPADAQVWGEIRGRVTEADGGAPIPGANVTIEGTGFGTSTSRDGVYSFRIPEGRYVVAISFIGYRPLRDSVAVGKGSTTVVDARLAEDTAVLDEAQVVGRRETAPGVSIISPATIRNQPLPVNDAIRAVKIELGVASNNELSNAFSVRGGSYDENQFFIDGFEVYRPLRTKQGEQEGLGLVNGDLAESLTLYAGGFPVRYGGKLASVLDVRYLRPAGAPTATGYLSYLDGGAQVSTGIGANAGVAVAARNSRPEGLFGSQELEGAYDPDFRDVQGLAHLDLGPGSYLRAVGLYARNRFRLAPSQRETTFGIFPNLVRTVAVDFEGLEEDGYQVGFGGLLLANQLGRFRMEHRASAYSTEEFEGFEVTSRASFFRRQQRPDGEPADLDRILEGTVLQTDFADNKIVQTSYTGAGLYRYTAGRHAAEGGWQARTLTFRDRLFETTFIQGTNDEGNPQEVETRRLEDNATLSEVQVAAWVEDGIDLTGDESLVVTPGARLDYFSYNDEWTVSPRLGLAWRAADQTTVAASAGVYHQAPTYRELRGDPQPGETLAAQLDGDIKSQRAIQGVVGLEHVFPQRRILLRAEAYAKRFSDLISYDTENTRVAYSGENDSEGYAAGFDVQLRGELVPGLESWVNYGFLKTSERFYAPDATGDAQADSLNQVRFVQRGGGDYVPRPTDRRHNLSVFVQDYVPGDDTFSIHIRTLYGTGLPFTAVKRGSTVDGVTIFDDGPRNQLRFESYTRFDLGASKELDLGATGRGRSFTLRATAEVLNVFDQTNVVDNSTVERTVGGRSVFEYVPTRLTPRTFNVRLRLDF